MIHILNKIPQSVYVACSGGVDSMALVSFLLGGKKDIGLLFFDHGTETSKHAKIFVKDFASQNNLTCITGEISRFRYKEESPEEYWRNERYAFFEQHQDRVILTAHHLDDAVETWIMSCFHGSPKIIPYNNGIVARPLLLNTKQSLVDWCTRKNVLWIEDLSNKDISVPRNRIRHEIVKQALEINPGLYKTIRKKYNDQQNSI